MAEEEPAASGVPKPEPQADSGAPGPPPPPSPSPPSPPPSSPRQQTGPKAESSQPLHLPPASPTAINTAAAASTSVTGGETLAAAPSCGARAAKVGGGSGGGGGGGAACSFSQLLAGAMGSAAAVATAAGAVPILAVPVDAARLSVVAVPCFIAPAALLDSPGFTGQFAMTHQAVLATVTAQAQLQLQLQAAQPSSSSDSLTNSSPQPSVSAITPLPLQQRPPPIPEENVCTTEAELSPSLHQKPQSARIVLRTNSSDGYNWRKYGQKQVKCSDSSRSYYRCANADCSVKKKVQHYQDGRVIQIVYKGCHNHDPPQKTRFSKERRSLSAGPLVESEDLEPPSGELNESNAFTPKAEQDCSNTSPEQRLHCSSDCEEDSGVKTNDLADEPEPKRRLCDSTTPSSTPSLKIVREPKIVVQSPGDAGLVNDGYKWRKYGQKFVKGNPNPRSYYRCTQFGCPVRKHVERASDDSTAFVITYEGKHNHDQPSPRNGSDPPPAAVPAAAANAGQIQTSECLLDPKPTPERLHDADGEINDVKRIGSEKALESAQTLLSIGEASRNNSEGIQRPLFDENHAAVPVQNS